MKQKRRVFEDGKMRYTFEQIGHATVKMQEFRDGIGTGHSILSSEQAQEEICFLLEIGYSEAK